MNDDRMKADVLHQHDVPREAVAKLRIHHRVPAILDDEHVPMKLPNVGERLLEDLGLRDQVIHALAYSTETAANFTLCNAHSTATIAVGSVAPFASRWASSTKPPERVSATTTTRSRPANCPAHDWRPRKPWRRTQGLGGSHPGSSDALATDPRQEPRPAPPLQNVLREILVR
jgi:hypothetical protein